MVKNDIVWGYNQNSNFKFCNKYLNLLLARVKGPDNPVKVYEDNFHIEDDFKYGSDAFKQTLTNEKIVIPNFRFTVTIVLVSTTRLSSYVSAEDWSNDCAQEPAQIFSCIKSQCIRVQDKTPVLVKA